MVRTATRTRRKLLPCSRTSLNVVNLISEKSSSATSATATLKIGLVSLGCAKNLVDSEIMAGHLHKAGMALTPNPDEADVMIVNTCSFIDAAKEESIGAILDANRDRGMRRRHGGQKLIVAGCMAQRFAGELSASMPEVDAFIGLDQLTQIAPIPLCRSSTTPALWCWST